MTGEKMIKLTCARCGNLAYKVIWVVSSNRIPEDGIFKKEDLVGTATYRLLGYCPRCKGEFGVKGDWSWRLTGGRGWKDLEDDETHLYEFGEKQG